MSGLTRSGSGVDAVSGLPWSEIARYRVVEDPDFGPVPQYVGSARQLAIRDASEHERERAAMLVDRADRMFADLTAEMDQHCLIWLPDLLRAAAAEDDELLPVLDDQVEVWKNPRMQHVLMREHSRGWPVAFEGDEA
jgi:hypothetical protein